MRNILISRPVFFLVTMAVVLSAFFRQEIYAYLFSPDGLSMAKSQICVLNESDQEPIVTIEVENGATNVVLLFAGEKICSLSPNRESYGIIKVSLEDGGAPFCIIEATSYQKYLLLSYDGKEQCEWGRK